jgi:hypothetical protein
VFLAKKFYLYSGHRNKEFNKQLEKEYEKVEKARQKILNKRLLIRRCLADGESF